MRLLSGTVYYYRVYLIIYKLEVKMSVNSLFLFFNFRDKEQLSNLNVDFEKNFDKSMLQEYRKQMEVYKQLCRYLSTLTIAT
jgi:hypothetical protein